MKTLFILCLIVASLFASSERKIIVGTYYSEENAENTLKELQSQVNSEFLAAQKRYGFSLGARASGDKFIVVVEPFENYAEAKSIKKLLPEAYASAYINEYVPPKVTLAADKTVEKKDETVKMSEEPTTVKEPSIVATQNIEQNLTKKDQPKSTENILDKKAKPPMPSYVIDVISMKLIDTKTAYYVVGGHTYGTMAPTKVFAFSKKEHAEKYVKINGGSVVDYKAAFGIE